MQEALEAELRRHAAPALPAGAPDLLAACFAQQLAFILDPAPLKAAFCTRRAAKSYSVGLDFINDSFTHPHAHYLILGLTRQSVKDAYWDHILKDIDRKYSLGARFNESELTMRLPNGALIKIAGADANETERRKFLGGKKRKVAVDEAQDFGTDLRALVMGVLKPSVADLEGQILLTGTPSNLIGGFFHQVTKGCKAGRLSPPEEREPGWSLHTWTTFDNPHMVRQWTADIEGMLAANPAIRQVPWFRQNYLGEWVVDLDALCYRFDPTRNSFDGSLPRWDQKGGTWHYVLAVDLGYYPDPSAFVVLAYHDYMTTLFVLESWKQWKMDITDVAQRVRAYEATYNFDALVIDGANKQAVEEMRRRHGLDLVCADKTGKADFIELMNAELVLGRIKVNVALCNQGVPDTTVRDGNKTPESLSLVDEWTSLIWDMKKLREKNKREELASCPNHLADAALYGWRHCYQYLSQAPVKPPAPNTPEWFAAEVARMRQESEREMLARLDEEPSHNEGLGDSSNWEWWER